MPDEFDARSVEILHTLGLTEAMVRDHVLDPGRLADAAQHIELHDAGDVVDADVPPPSGLLYRLDTAQLSIDLFNLLSPCLGGYALQLRRYGRVVFEHRWKQARTAPDGGIDWAPDVQMHVASVSKLITAMAMTTLLHDRGISIDARIARWLPAYWLRGPGVDRLTFRQLLTHTSGLVALNEPGRTDYPYLKEHIALGVVGGVGYRNLNYGLCRILISTIDAPYLFQLLGPGVTDGYWDLTTIRYYQRYVQEHVFDPVGVTSGFTGTTDHALAYPFPVTSPGLAEADASAMSGAVGWHLSVDDLLAIMANFRRLGGIVDPVRAQTMLDRQIGFDLKEDTPLGRIYGKGGFWSFEGARYVQQTNVFFLPKGMELAILANTPLCKPDTGFMGDVFNAIKRNIHFNWLTVAVAATTAFGIAGLVRHARAPRRP
jgi:CubicO group peptidase (beta-lactamase class C family)